LLKHVVVERLLEDRRIDQIGDVLERAQVGGIDHRLHPATGRDDFGSDLVASAVPLSSSRGAACVALVEPSFVVTAGAAPAGSALGDNGANAAAGALRLNRPRRIARTKQEHDACRDHCDQTREQRCTARDGASLHAEDCPGRAWSN
jgi:hypothetical protein